MRYLSTRGHADRKQFCDILLEGLAPDGGLYLPEHYPQVDDAALTKLRKAYHEQGYADTTMDQVVAALGVTKPYVYSYFRNKQEIFEVLAWRPTVACFTVLDFPPEDQRPAHVKVAEGLEQVSEALRRRDLADLVESVEDFARRQPVAFIGGTVAAGLAFGRFMKSSAARREG